MANDIGLELARKAIDHIEKDGWAVIYFGSDKVTIHTSSEEHVRGCLVGYDGDDNYVAIAVENISAIRLIDASSGA